MDKVYQVFVSSTFDDLKEERREVSNAIAKAGHIAAGMELFPATDQQQLEYIQRVIDRSDYYVVIVGARYGSEASNGLSFTENECDYARSKGIPVLAFLPADPDSIPNGKTDSDPSKIKKLDAFKTKLKSGRIVEFWKGKADLCMKVVISVGQSINLFPGVGWVRGDQAIDPKLLQEASRLKLENSRLQSKLAEFEKTAPLFNPRFVGPEETMPLRVRMKNFSEKKEGVFEETRQIGEFLVRIYEDLIFELSEEDVARHLGQAIAHDKGQSTNDINEIHWVDGNDLVRLRNQLEALGLIETRAKTSNDFVGRKELTWKVTNIGKRFALTKIAQLAPVAAVAAAQHSIV